MYTTLKFPTNLSSHLEEDKEDIKLLLAAAMVKVLATSVQEDAYQTHTEIVALWIQR